ncbi:MAG: UvrB/UvrC motif-containing protein [bacterium]|nr:UvrB/UvrC motif-containing protein [bacterium]
MMCENCNVKQASVYYTQVVNGEAKAGHLCEVCALSKGANMLESFPFFELSIVYLLAGFLNVEPKSPNSSASAKICPTCKMGLASLVEGGRLGCADCYKTYYQQIEPLLKRIHGSTLHQGKMPKGAAQEILRQRKIVEMKDELRLAVQTEKYEKAATLRDAIKKLEETEGRNKDV